MIPIKRIWKWWLAERKIGTFNLILFATMLFASGAHDLSEGLHAYAQGAKHKAYSKLFWAFLNFAIMLEVMVESDHVAPTEE